MTRLLDDDNLTVWKGYHYEVSKDKYKIVPSDKASRKNETKSSSWQQNHCALDRDHHQDKRTVCFTLRREATNEISAEIANTVRNTRRKSL